MFPVASFEEVSAADSKLPMLYFSRQRSRRWTLKTGATELERIHHSARQQTAGKTPRDQAVRDPLVERGENRPTLDPTRLHSTRHRRCRTPRRPPKPLTPCVPGIGHWEMLVVRAEHAGRCWVVGGIREKDSRECPSDAGPTRFRGMPFEIVTGGKSILIAEKSGNVWGQLPIQSPAVCVVWRAVFLESAHPPPASRTLVQRSVGPAALAFKPSVWTVFFALSMIYLNKRRNRSLCLPTVSATGSLPWSF